MTPTPPPNPHNAPHVQPAKASTTRLPGAENIHVLIVEDNHDQVMMLTGSLQLNGFTVRSASTGTEGLRIAQEWSPDIVLLDIGLSDISGYEVARQLRASELGKKRIPRMRLIALTGLGREADKKRAFEAGIDAHLTKPCDLDYLAMLMASLTPTKHLSPPPQP